MKVRDIMTTNVACVNPDSPVVEAARLMRQHNVGSIPVCDQSGVVGIVTDRDIIVRSIAQGNNPQNTPVKNVMTTNVATASPDMDVEDVTRMMSMNQIRRVPVVDSQKIVGILALGDLATEHRFHTEASEALSEISKPSNPQ